MEAEAEVLNSKAVSAEAAANKTSIEREKLKALIKDVPPFESTDTYAEIKRDIDTTQAQIDALQDCKDAKIAEKKAEIAEIENQICELNIEVAKFDADSNFSGIYLISFPGDIPKTSENLNASVPYFAIISNGSIPLPKLLDIFLPRLSRTIPWINTLSNGTWPVCSNAENIILATQKNIIS